MSRSLRREPCLRLQDRSEGAPYPHKCSARWCLQAFCDERGEPLTSHEAGERLTRELELDREMRMYNRRGETPRSAPAHAPHILQGSSESLVDKGRLSGLSETNVTAKNESAIAPCICYASAD